MYDGAAAGAPEGKNQKGALAQNISAGNQIVEYILGAADKSCLTPLPTYLIFC